MSGYAFPIEMALVVFPFLALALAFPFMIVQYRRYGSFIFWRAVVLYTFIFYLLAAYFLIILPLPSRSAVAAYTTPRYNLVPFTAVREFFATTVFRLNAPATWLAALKQPGFIQPTFNIVLTIPFGVYLRYYFKRSLPQIIAISFMLSLFFELTQLSGLYFIYPRPYRLFDVDDLILNTTGGLIGGLLAPLMMRVFPSRDEMDQRSYQKGQRVSWMRRFAAFVVDNVVVVPGLGFLLGLLMQWLTGASWARSVGVSMVAPMVIVFGLLPVINRGQTPGKALVRIRIVNESGAPAGPWQLLWREFLLYGAAGQSLRGFLYFFGRSFGQRVAGTDVEFALMGIFGLLVAFVGANFLWEMVTRDNHYFYDVWAHTKQVSTIAQPKEAGGGSDRLADAKNGG